MMKGRLRFLGSGGSMGIPVIGCDCAVCQSEDPKNQRLRPSAIIEIDGKVLLIDPGPDFRQQALKFGIDHIDGVLLTHAHNDHIAGIDELRVYYARQKQPLPLLLSNETYQGVAARFSYIFASDRRSQGLIVNFDLQLLDEDRGQVRFADLQLGYLSFEQAAMKVTGFRIGRFAYVSDIRTFPDTIFEDLDGVEVLVLSALRFTPSYLHFSIDEAVAFAECVGAKQVWLTHISHEIDHQTGNAHLPPHVRLAHDGLEIPFSY